MQVAPRTLGVGSRSEAVSYRIRGLLGGGDDPGRPPRLPVAALSRLP